MTQGQKPDRSGIPSRSLLEGHVRDKKRLVPPLLKIPQTSFVSTIDSIFPEVMWIGMLLDWHGVGRGIEVVSGILDKLWNADMKTDWYRFSELSSRAIDKILTNDEIIDLVEPFSALKTVYDLSGLDWAASNLEISTLKEQVISSISKYVDRFDQPYLTIISTVIYSMGISGKMHFGPGTAPDIEAIVSDWGSEKSKMAASSVRACSMTFSMEGVSKESEDWCKHFWRKNYQMSGCQ